MDRERRRQARWHELVAIAVVLLGGASRALAQGTLDRSFAGDGFAIVDVEARAIARDGVLLEPDGAVTVVLSTGSETALVRLDASGARDTTFGDAGVASPLPGLSASAAARAADGGILIGGRMEGRSILVRLLSDGTLDQSFGLGGIVLDVGGTDLEIQGDGKIVSLGDGLYRLLPDGRSDLAFGARGFAAPPTVSDENGGRLTPRALAIQPDGIVVAANYDVATVTIGLLYRHDRTGRLDRTYGDQGTAQVGTTGATDVVALADRSVLVLDRFAVKHFSADGELDPADAPPIESSGPGVAQILVDTQGRLLTAGGFSVESAPQVTAPLLERFLAGGAPDPSFGATGRAVLRLDPPFGAQGTAFGASALLPDGRIVAAATACRSLDDCRLVVARFTAERSSGVQLSPDGRRQMVVKNVGDERWTIVRNVDDGTVTGNVDAAGRAPQFLWCTPGDGGAPGDVALECWVAGPCAVAPCGGFVPAGRVVLPESFFLPPPPPA